MFLELGCIAVVLNVDMWTQRRIWGIDHHMCGTNENKLRK